MSLATSTPNNNLQVFEFFARCLRWIAATTYVLTVILLMFYFVKYYYHRCILIPEVHHVRILPHRCRKYREARRFIWFFIIVPYVLKKAWRTLKFIIEFDEKKRFERYAFLSYFYFCVLLVFFAVDIYFEVYWDPEWHEVMFYYYLPEMDVYFTGFDTLSMEYFGLD